MLHVGDYNVGIQKVGFLHNIMCDIDANVTCVLQSDQTTTVLIMVLTVYLSFQSDLSFTCQSAV